MILKKIYLLRHGETDYNLRGVVQGSGINASLNNTGKLQADAFYLAYKNQAFDKVYTSALRRSQESVRKFIEKGIPHESYEGLNEISWGDHEGNGTDQIQNNYYHEVLDKWKEGRTDMIIGGGESPEDVVRRQQPVMQHILDQHDEQKILMCIHGRAMRILLCQLLNYPLKYMDIFEHNNLGLYELTYTGKQFIIDKFNDTSHLKILETL
ncbi:MAG: histidine phosphatase family protein [Cyclobacteriaceae bacterium]|nr:histidine phosphatase family protein [Cyclobacteriaceae bacterium]